MHVTDARVAIITGASLGVGSAVAERLAKDGFSVVINYLSNQTPAEKLARKIDAAGGHALAIRADVSDPAAVQHMFSSTEAAFGGIDILVNNAGVMRLANLAGADDGLFDQHIAVNLRGTFNCLREAAKRLRDNGRIINFSSSVVGLYQPSYSIYAATKAGVEAMTHVLSKELRGRNITVNAVAPGPTGTDLFLKGKSKDLIDHYAKLSPLERLGLPEDIANAVAFLAGPDAGWINGQILRANGGIL
jgi:3-oxoacyl-[acyl-carrier protein] reductase